MGSMHCRQKRRIDRMILAGAIERSLASEFDYKVCGCAVLLIYTCAQVRRDKWLSNCQTEVVKASLLQTPPLVATTGLNMFHQCIILHIRLVKLRTACMVHMVHMVDMVHMVGCQPFDLEGDKRVSRQVRRWEALPGER
jgi:hypothetical protein